MSIILATLLFSATPSKSNTPKFFLYPLIDNPHDWFRVDFELLNQGQPYPDGSVVANLFIYNDLKVPIYVNILLNDSIEQPENLKAFGNNVFVLGESKLTLRNIRFLPKNLRPCPPNTIPTTSVFKCTLPLEIRPEPYGSTNEETTKIYGFHAINIFFISALGFIATGDEYKTTEDFILSEASLFEEGLEKLFKKEGGWSYLEFYILVQKIRNRENIFEIIKALSDVVEDYPKELAKLAGYLFKKQLTEEQIKGAFSAWSVAKNGFIGGQYLGNIWLSRDLTGTSISLIPIFYVGDENTTPDPPPIPRLSHKN